MSGVYLTVLILVAVGLSLAMIRGLRAGERLDKAHRDKESKIEDERRTVISEDGKVSYIPGPPTIQKQTEVSDASAWGGIDMPSDHSPSDGHGSSH